MRKKFEANWWGLNHFATYLAKLSDFFLRVGSQKPSLQSIGCELEGKEPFSCSPPGHIEFG